MYSYGVCGGLSEFPFVVAVRLEVLVSFGESLFQFFGEGGQFFGVSFVGRFFGDFLPGTKRFFAVS
jgi:hypothetical protein